jgi:hypothetical protein
MIMKHHWTDTKILILGACLLAPSLAFAHGVTSEGLAVFLLRVDFVILPFAVICVLISNGLGVRLLTLFSTINIAISIVGILLKVLVYAWVATFSTNDLIEFSAVMALYLTGYLVIAVPIYFVFLPILAVVRSLANKKRAFKKKPTN